MTVFLKRNDPFDPKIPEHEIHKTKLMTKKAVPGNRNPQNFKFTTTIARILGLITYNFS